VALGVLDDGATMAVMIQRKKIDSVPRGEHVPTADHRIVMYGVSWDAFEAFLALRGDARPRVTYSRGALELMSPSSDHEIIKKRFAACIEAYFNQLGITYEGVGEWLIKRAPDASLEPDECYMLHTKKDRPDLAIEVVWTSGGIDKLKVYQTLCIPEVWFWIDDKVTVHVLTDAGYETRTKSALVPDFDFSLVGEMLALPNLSDVHRALRERLPIAK